MANRLALGTLVAASVVAGCGVNPVGQALQSAIKDPFANLMDGQAISGEVIVQLKPGAALPKVAGAKQVSEIDLEDLGKFVLVKATDKGATNLEKAFSQQPMVAGVTPNRVLKMPIPKAKPPLPALGIPTDASGNDPLRSQQWYLDRVGAEQAWSVTDGKGIVVAVVDTGVDYTHPDLKDQVVGKGHSFVNNRPDGLDEQGHGTHVAGTIAAQYNNNEGVVGVAKGAKILPVQVLSASGGGSLYSIAQGIKYAADYGVQNKVRVVVNLSLGGAATVDPVSYTTGWYATGKGALLVAAAGNSNTAVGTPARWDKYYMAISALDEKDEKANFSCYGPEISVGAPGTNIMATTPSYDVPLNKYGYPKWYAPLQGTSMACPIAASVCALTWSVHPDWSWKQVRQHVEKTAKDLGKSGKDDHTGYGIVQAAAAVGLK
ncbi:MAG: S8 family serine peptidase [Candidatus Sericytochromatia bacterium]|nr:S8 family serine peptidase [Candidatus Tanganyikabacteria bacterium]